MKTRILRKKVFNYNKLPKSMKPEEYVRNMLGDLIGEAVNCALTGAAHQNTCTKNVVDVVDLADEQLILVNSNTFKTLNEYGLTKDQHVMIEHTIQDDEAISFPQDSFFLNIDEMGIIPHTKNINEGYIGAELELKNMEFTGDTTEPPSNDNLKKKDNWRTSEHGATPILITINYDEKET